MNILQDIPINKYRTIIKCRKMFKNKNVLISVYCSRGEYRDIYYFSCLSCVMHFKILAITIKRTKLE